MHVIACNYKQLHALHAITCNYTFFYSSQNFSPPLQAILLHLHSGFVQQTCSIRTRNFILTLAHGWWQDSCPILTQQLPSTRKKEETLQVFAMWSSWNSAQSVYFKAGTIHILIQCQRSLLMPRPLWFMWWLQPWASLISRRQISCWVTLFLANTLWLHTIWCKYIIITCFLHSVCMQILTSFFPSSWVPDSQLLKLCNYHVIDK